MTFTYQRTYAGPVRAVVLDWAGTTVDFGCCAPVEVFRASFAALGLETTDAEVRGPMGTEKRDHIRSVLSLPAVTERWRAARGRDWTEDDVLEVFERFLPMQVETVSKYAQVIAGVPEMAAELKERGIGIGSSTGYPGAVMDVLVPLAAEQGYSPDVVLSGTDLNPGRPAPFLIWENMRRLGVYPAAAVVKVDDSLAGIEAALNAGCWAVGIAASGTLVGKRQDEFEALDEDVRDALVEAARDKMYRAGAHMVLDTIAELPAAIDEFDDNIAGGALP